MSIYGRFDINFDNVQLDEVVLKKPVSVSVETWMKFWERAREISAADGDDAMLEAVEDLELELDEKNCRIRELECDLRDAQGVLDDIVATLQENAVHLKHIKLKIDELATAMTGGRLI